MSESEDFRRCARLSGQEVFGALLRSRRSARGERFLVQVLATGRPFARLAIVVSKRVQRRAVDRNYAKRLIRETFRREKHRLRGFDVLVRPRQTLLRSDALAAASELRSLLVATLR